MNHHLTEGQFEDILRDAAGVPEHVGHCRLCQAELDEHRAMAQRVRQASFAVQASPALADRIRAGVAALGKTRVGAPGRVRLLPLRMQRHLWSGLAAVAALLMVAVSIGFYVRTGAPANAAPITLAEIHHRNLNSLGQLVNSDDPGVLCAYLESQVGHSPAMLSMGSGSDMCGCCVRKFQGQPVASYVIKRGNTAVSIVAVPQPPEALGMAPTEHRTAALRDIWQARHRCCNIAAVRIGEYSYCAVGQIAQEELAILLDALPGPVEVPQ